MSAIELKAPGRLAWVYVIAFCGFATAGAALLPATMSYDTTTMVEGIEDKTGLDTSFQRMSQTIELLTYEGTTLLVMLLGAFVIKRMVERVRTMRTLAVLTLSLGGAVPLCLMRPQKEVYVILLTCLALGAIYRWHGARAVLVTIGLYIAYALLLGRSYYLLITAAFVVVTLLQRSSRQVRWLSLVAILAFGFLIPTNILEPLQAARDALNLYRVLDSTEPGNRTAFMNPVEGVGWIPFLMNYLYAAARLSFPIFFSTAPQELFLTLVSVSWFWLVWRGFRSRDEVARRAAALIVSHMAILWLFEPDLGSYLRHLTSMLVYLLPLLHLVDDEALGAPS